MAGRLIDSKTLNELHIKCQENGGKCISDKFGEFGLIDFECNSCHKFTLTILAIRKGKWCPECETSTPLKMACDYLTGIGYTYEKDKKIDSMIFNVSFMKEKYKWVHIDFIETFMESKSIRNKIEHSKKHNNQYMVFVGDDIEDIEKTLESFIDSNNLYYTNDENIKDIITSGRDIDLKTVKDRKEAKDRKEQKPLMDEKSLQDIKEKQKIKDEETVKAVKEITFPDPEKYLMKPSQKFTKDGVSYIDRTVVDTAAIENDVGFELMRKLLPVINDDGSVKLPVVAVVGYIRVSTNEQKNNGISLDAQEANIRDYAKSKGVKVRHIYKDGGISGKNIDKRPGLKRCLDEIKAQEELVCVSQSRLSRDVKDTYDIIGRLNKKKAILKFLDMEGEINTTNGRMLVGIKAVLSAYERDVTVDRVTEAVRHATKTGMLRSKPPFGYRYDGPKKPFVEDPGEMEVIKMMKDWISKNQDKNRSDLVRVLNSTNLKCRSAKMWYHRRVSDIIKYHKLEWGKQIKEE